MNGFPAEINGQETSYPKVWWPASSKSFLPRLVTNLVHVPDEQPAYDLVHVSKDGINLISQRGNH